MRAEFFMNSNQNFVGKVLIDWLKTRCMIKYETFEMAFLRNSLVRFRTSTLVSPDSGGKSSGSTLAFIAISIHLSIGMFSWIPKFCSRSRLSWTMFFEGTSDTLFCSRICWQVLRLKLVSQELLHFGVTVNYLLVGIK